MAVGAVVCVVRACGAGCQGQKKLVVTENVAPTVSHSPAHSTAVTDPMSVKKPLVIEGWTPAALLTHALAYHTAGGGGLN